MVDEGRKKLVQLRLKKSNIVHRNLVRTYVWKKSSGSLSRVKEVRSWSSKIFKEVVDGARFTKVLAIFAFGANANDETKQLAAMIRKAKETGTLFILLLNWFRNNIVKG